MNQSEYLIVHLIFVVVVYHINKIEKTHKQLDIPKIEDKKDPDYRLRRTLLIYLIKCTVC